MPYGISDPGSFICTLAAIAAITGIELYALKKGINGKVMSLCLGLIAGLGGFLVRGAI